MNFWFKHLENAIIENICCYLKWPQIKHLLVFDIDINVQKNLNKIVGHKKTAVVQEVVVPKTNIFIFASYCV